MKKIKVIPFLVLVLMLGLSRQPAAAASYLLQYKLKPGQRWVTNMSSQSETEVMGKKDINRTKSVIDYKMSAAAKKGWVGLTAKIRSQINSDGQEIGTQSGLDQIEFKAQMHVSGETRNPQSLVKGLPPQMAQNMADLPPAMAEMMKQSMNVMAEGWKESIFWFPEFPEKPLKVGEEFEVTRKTRQGNAAAGMQTEAVSKQVFTLDEVKNGLAYFSVTERTLMKSSNLIGGGKADVKSLSKSEAVFDLNEGMWIEMVSKHRSKVEFSGGTSPGKSETEVLSITKYEMHKP